MFCKNIISLNSSHLVGLKLKMCQQLSIFYLPFVIDHTPTVLSKNIDWNSIFYVCFFYSTVWPCSALLSGHSISMAISFNTWRKFFRYIFTFTFTSFPSLFFLHAHTHTHTFRRSISSWFSFSFTRFSFASEFAYEREKKKRSIPLYIRIQAEFRETSVKEEKESLFFIISSSASSLEGRESANRIEQAGSKECTLIKHIRVTTAALKFHFSAVKSIRNTYKVANSSHHTLE